MTTLTVRHRPGNLWPYGTVVTVLFRPECFRSPEATPRVYWCVPSSGYVDAPHATREA